jgi:hypothetical protein
VDQVMSFVGHNKDLPKAITEAQAAANAWLQQHSAAVATIYSATSQSVWHASRSSWYHVIMLTLQVYNSSTTTPEHEAAES